MGKTIDGSAWVLVALVLMASMFFGLRMASAADPAKGREGYNQYCVTCHGADGRGMMGNTPDFSRGEGLMAPDVTIAQTLRTGKGTMPAFVGILSSEELLDIVAYLRTLQR
jgi:cytochrome c6